MPTILVTNDDGVYSPGLLALKQGLEKIADVMVLGPERNWSASSHSKTMHKPLRLQQVVLADGSAAHSSSGSPTDCVALAVAGVLGKVPDLVVSGINLGHNLGIDVTYSGTVACAMEAVIHGIPGIAVSSVTATQIAEQTGADLHAIQAQSAVVACELALQVLKRGLPPRTLLNVNTPAVDPMQWRGLHRTRMGQRQYPNDELLERHDPYGRPYYWLGGGMPLDALDEGTDVGAVANGYVSVTPIMLDLTHHGFLAEMAEWDLTRLGAVG
jgi:5'-nucleotidase